MNLFLTEEDVVKLGYYGLTTQAECYSIKKKDCDGVRSFAPEVFRGEYEAKCDLWSFGITMIEMMGLTPYVENKKSNLPIMDDLLLFPYRICDVESKDVAGFLRNWLEGRHDKWTVNDLLFVRVMGWRMMNRSHLLEDAKEKQVKCWFHW